MTDNKQRRRLYMNKNKDLRKENQVQVERFPLSREFMDDPEMFWDRSTNYEITAFDRFIRFLRDHNGQAEVSNYRLAELFGCSVISVCRWKKRWAEHGLIKIEKVIGQVVREYGMGTAQRPSRYILNSYFMTEEAERTLGDIFESVKYLTLSLLMVTGSLFSPYSIANENYERVNNKAIWIKNNLESRSAGENFVGRYIVRKLVKKGTVVMDPVRVIEHIPKRIRDIKVIKLTPHGMMRLLCFSDEAIDWAEQRMNERKKFIVDVFSYFVQLCMEYCKIHNIEPDYEQFNLVKESYGYRDDKPMVHVNVVYRSKTLVTPQQKQFGADGIAHPLSAPDSFATSKSFDEPIQHKIPQTGKDSDLEQGAQLSSLRENTLLANSQAYRKKRTMPYQPTSFGSLSRSDSKMVQSAQRCKEPHPLKEFDEEILNKHRTFKEKPKLDPDNEFVKILGLM